MEQLECENCNETERVSTLALLNPRTGQVTFVTACAVCNAIRFDDEVGFLRVMDEFEAPQLLTDPQHPLHGLTEVR